MDTLFKHLTRPKRYLFPTPTAPRFNAAPPKSEGIPRLVTSILVLALYHQEPWKKYRRRVTPVSFCATGWFSNLSTIYPDSENRYRQAMWEATHALYLPLEQRERSPELAQLHKQRKQRRSRSGTRSKTVLHFILQ